MVQRNCVHFCNAMTHELGVGELPKWVNRAAKTGASIVNAFGTLKSTFTKKGNVRPLFDECPLSPATVSRSLAPPCAA